VEFEKVTEDFTDIVEGAWALGVPGELGPLPGGKLCVELMLQLGELHPQFADFVLDTGFGAARGCEFLDLFLDFAERLFKFKVIAHSDVPPGPGPSPIGGLRYQR
jgi:hypothetical protein